jgi:hypothetical protein
VKVLRTVTLHERVVEHIGELSSLRVSTRPSRYSELDTNTHGGE